MDFNRFCRFPDWTVFALGNYREMNKEKVRHVKEQRLVFEKVASYVEYETEKGAEVRAAFFRLSLQSSAYRPGIWARHWSPQGLRNPPRFFPTARPGLWPGLGRT